MKLTEHFSLDEFTVSSTAESLGINNDPAPAHLLAIREVAKAMERVRALFGRSVYITSGYRSPELNRAVGGVPTSAHALGWACDFHVAGFTDRKVAERIRDSGIKFDQLIWEGTAAHPRCVHISFDPRMRQQVLSQPGGPGTAVHQGIG